MQAEVQVAIVGALALLLGAGITAWFAFRQYRLQRALEVKKEVLLESVRGALGATSSFAALCDIDRPLADISGHFSACLAKLTVAGAVADISTVRAGTTLLNALGPAFLELLVARSPVEALHGELIKIESLRECQHADNGRYFRMQEDAIASGDGVRAKNIQMMFDAGTKMHSDLVCERDSANLGLPLLRKSLAIQMFDAQANLQPLLRKYVACVRNDIGVVGSEQDFLAAAFIDPSFAKQAMLSAFDKIGKVKAP